MHDTMTYKRKDKSYNKLYSTMIILQQAETLSHNFRLLVPCGQKTKMVAQGWILSMRHNLS